MKLYIIGSTSVLGRLYTEIPKVYKYSTLVYLANTLCTLDLFYLLFSKDGISLVFLFLMLDIVSYYGVVSTVHPVIPSIEV